MNPRRHFTLCSLAVLAAASFSPLAQAQTWPTQPLKIIVPFAPGGSSDFIARLIAKPLGDALKTTVVVENKPGNAGNLGATIVAQATDQHTVMLSDISSIAISQMVVKDLAYKITDLRGVAMLGYSPHLLAANPNLAANNLKDLVELSKKKRINVASSGSGSPNHLGVVEIALATGMQWQHIPYKGGAQALGDTVAGNADIVLNGMLATLPQVTGGKLKVIGVSKKTRVAGLPNSPTIAEQGMTGFETGTYQGVTAPATLSRDIVAKLNAELVKVMNQPDIKKRMEESGAEVMTGSPDEISNFLNAEKSRWEGVIAKAGKNIEGTQ